jgi:hypothetical protein
MPTAPAPGFAALGLRQPEDLKRMGANTAFVLNGYPGLALSRLRPNVRDGSKAERLTPSKCYPVCFLGHSSVEQPLPQGARSNARKARRSEVNG